MKSIRIENLRSIEDSGEIEIKPITIVVGMNSSGKSTLVRFFPLLKQSVEVATSGPLLWYGDYVDFGSIEAALRKLPTGESATSIDLSFRFETDSLRLRLRRRPTQPTQFREVEAKISISANLSEKKDSHLSCATYSIGDHSLRVDLQADGNVRDISLNSRSILGRIANKGIQANSCAFFPTTFSEAEKVAQPERSYLPLEHVLYRGPSYSGWYAPGFRARDFITDRLIETIFRKSDRRGPAFFDACRTLLELDALADSACVPRWVSSHSRSERDRNGIRLNIDAQQDTLNLASDLLVIRQMSELVAACEFDLLSLSDRIVYSGPIRAHPSRYYRRQEVAVRDVDHQGANLPMFLRSLSDTEFTKFSAFMSDHFGVSIARHIHDELIEILVNDGRNSSNLVDAGFGYSQILPVVAQLWGAVHRGSRTRGRTASLVVLEQPELHLHPAHQSRIADMLCGAIASSRSLGEDVRILMETHSEAILNRIGDLIYEQKLSSDQVSVIVFEWDADRASAQLRKASFDSEGKLLDWPYGFFSP